MLQSLPEPDQQPERRDKTPGHQPVETLCARDVQEWKEFQQQQLELDKNKLLKPGQHDRVLMIFLDNFDAVSGQQGGFRF